MERRSWSSSKTREQRLLGENRSTAPHEECRVSLLDEKVHVTFFETSEERELGQLDNLACCCRQRRDTLEAFTSW